MSLLIKEGSSHEEGGSTLTIAERQYTSFTAAHEYLEVAAVNLIANVEVVAIEKVRR